MTTSQQIVDPCWLILCCMYGVGYETSQWQDLPSHILVQSAIGSLKWSFKITGLFSINPIHFYILETDFPKPLHSVGTSVVTCLLHE